MALIPIPEPWRKDVCAILETGEKKLIRWTRDSENDFQTSFIDAWPYELYEAFRSYLGGASPMGCEKHMDHPPGSTYDFFFPFKGKKTYGKILLGLNRQFIVIFSAHLPQYPTLSCE